MEQLFTALTKAVEATPASANNLTKWVEQNPYETGRLISISQTLADKMKPSPEQIQKACKIGECAPK